MPDRVVTADYVRGWLGRRPEIRSKVVELMLEQLRDVELAGRNLVVCDVIVKYVLKTLERDLEVMSLRGVDRFRIEGLEIRLRARVGNFRFKGYIDRLDSFADGEVRVVDYKTGKVLPEDLEITDDRAQDTAAALFGDTPYFRKPKIAFQLFIYDMLLRNNGLDRGRNILDSVYSTARLFSEVPQTVPMGEAFYTLMMDGLEKMLAEMEDLSVPFRRTDDMTVCQYCDFRTVCGR